MCLLFSAIITMAGIGSWNRHRKSLFSRLQNPNGIVYPTSPVERGCRATWSECGEITQILLAEKKWRRWQKVFPFGKASIADGIPPAAENGRTRAPFWFAGKRLASFAPAIPHRTGSARRYFGICCEVSRGVFPWEFQESRRLFWGKSQIKAMIREIWEASEQHNCRCERSDKKTSRPRKGCSKSLGW